MIYQVRANCFFDVEDEARDFYHDCELALPKARTVNPGQPEMEISLIELIENRHDEDPHAPCTMVLSEGSEV